MANMNLTDRQTALEYAIHMVASRYFKSVVCKPPFTESGMLVQYKEQNSKNQNTMENISIRFMESLTKKFPQRLFEQDMTVRLIKKENRPTEIVFKNKDFMFNFIGVCKKHGYKIDCQVWYREKSGEGKKGKWVGINSSNARIA